MTYGDLLDEERIAGRAEGREEGEENRLIRQVCRKLRKGQDYVEIAEDLVEDEAHIKAICDAAEKYAPDYNEELVIADYRPAVLV